MPYTRRMFLPSGDDAITEDGKLLDYVLNPDHPIGGWSRVMLSRRWSGNTTSLR